MDTINEATPAPVQTTAEATGPTTEAIEPTAEATGPRAVRWARPPLDVFEGDEGLLLLVDLPGVAREALSLELDSDQLTLSGIRADGVGLRRILTLSDDLERSGIEAQLEHGVLRVRLPRRAELRKRTIEIR